ncbi:MAG: EAL domain-containing protein [Planctomycetota bacterium]
MDRIAIQSPEHFEKFFAANPNPMLVIETGSWRILDVNKSAIEKYGYTHEEFLGLTVLDIRPPEDIPKFLALRPDVRRGMINPGVVRHLKKNGEIIYVDVFGHLVPWRGPKVMAILLLDVTARHRIQEEERRQHEIIIRRHEVLLDLAKTDFSDLPTALAVITQRVAVVMDVERAGVWFFTADHDSVVCEDLYLRSRRVHEKGLSIRTADHPRYFKHLEECLTIAAEDARTDPRTSEFASGYLDPLGIISMLDVPVRLAGRVVGILCLEHVGSLRRWTVEDQGFSSSVAEIVSVALEAEELRRAVEALRKSEERYALAARGTNDGLWDWDLVAGTVYYSPRWKLMLGCEEDEIGESSDEWFNRVHPEDIERLRADLDAHFFDKTEHFENIHRMLHKDGTYHWVLCRGVAVHDSIGHPTRIAGSQTDITDRKRVEEELARQAFYDSLTKLPNRALFLDRLTHTVKRARRRGKHLFAVLFMDLDRFKDINDSLGHSVGDQLLIAIAQRLDGCLRPGDTIARLGGDEFVILLEDIEDIPEATQVADRILRELAFPFSLVGQDIFVTSSIGIVPGTSDHTDPEDILRDADTAMYCAKEQGKSRYAVFDKTMHARAVSLLQMGSDLQRAVERREFRVVYQPIVDLRDGRICGFEALVRWIHPQRGILMPLEFIPTAEETGSILPMGDWVLREACRQAREWQTAFPANPPLTISVNISAKQFMQPDLLIGIDKMLDEMDLESGSLKLEITESVIMGKVSTTTSMLLQLRAIDVQLHLDDFGTGYSSLSYLHRFPFDALKIHRSFTKRLGTGNQEIVQTIITLAHGLKMEVIAEGVETPEQLSRLQALGCEYAQGFLFSKPVDSGKATVLLEKSLASSRGMYDLVRENGT